MAGDPWPPGHEGVCQLQARVGVAMHKLTEDMSCPGTRCQKDGVARV